MKCIVFCNILTQANLYEVRKNINLRDHAIFIGYAPFDDPRYSIAVIVENGESGGRVAGPIARDVLRELLNDI